MANVKCPAGQNCTFNHKDEAVQGASAAQKAAAKEWVNSDAAKAIQEKQKGKGGGGKGKKKGGRK